MHWRRPMCRWAGRSAALSTFVSSSSATWPWASAVAKAHLLAPLLSNRYALQWGIIIMLCCAHTTACERTCSASSFQPPFALSSDGPKGRPGPHCSIPTPHNQKRYWVGGLHVALSGELICIDFKAEMLSTWHLNYRLSAQKLLLACISRRQWNSDGNLTGQGKG